MNEILTFLTALLIGHTTPVHPKDKNDSPVHPKVTASQLVRDGDFAGKPR